MPKRRPSRSQRRRFGRVSTPPAAGPIVRPIAPVAPGVAPGAAPTLATAREAHVTRFTTRDYAYVKREVQRIVILATAVIITIVVLSFFFP